MATTRTRKTSQKQGEIAPTLIEAVCRRLGKGLRVRRTLPGRGRLHVDRQLPFLCVYRRPADREDAGTARLVKGEPAYLVVPGMPRFHKSLSSLVRAVVETLSAEFGAFLITEIWAAPDGGRANDPAVPSVAPTFTIYAPGGAGISRTVEALRRRLARVKVLKQAVRVEVVYDQKRTFPPDMKPLLSAAEARELNCLFLGLSVPPVYRKANTATEYPLILRRCGAA